MQLVLPIQLSWVPFVNSSTTTIFTTDTIYLYSKQFFFLIIKYSKREAESEKALLLVGNDTCSPHSFAKILGQLLLCYGFL